MKELIIFGTGDFARTASVYFKHDSPYRIAAFTVDAERVDVAELFGVPVVPFATLPQRFPPDRYSLFVAVGYNRVNRGRRDVYERCKSLGYELPTYISSHCRRWDDLQIGDNCFIFENNVIQPFVEIGNDVVMWSGNHVGHDSRIGDHCFIASHAVIAGRVTIGTSCFIGVNATIRDNVTIAPDCVIGAGALILGDTVSGGVYAGTPTRAREPKSSELRRI